LEHGQKNRGKTKGPQQKLPTLIRDIKTNGREIKELSVEKTAKYEGHQGWSLNAEGGGRSEKSHGTETKNKVKKTY